MPRKSFRNWSNREPNTHVAHSSCAHRSLHLWNEMPISTIYDVMGPLWVARSRCIIRKGLRKNSITVHKEQRKGIKSYCTYLILQSNETRLMFFSLLAQPMLPRLRLVVIWCAGRIEMLPRPKNYTFQKGTNITPGHVGISWFNTRNLSRKKTERLY